MKELVTNLTGNDSQDTNSGVNPVYTEEMNITNKKSEIQRGKTEETCSTKQLFIYKHLIRNKSFAQQPLNTTSASDTWTKLEGYTDFSPTIYANVIGNVCIKDLQDCGSLLEE